MGNCFAQNPNEYVASTQECGLWKGAFEELFLTSADVRQLHKIFISTKSLKLSDKLSDSVKIAWITEYFNKCKRIDNTSALQILLIRGHDRRGDMKLTFMDFVFFLWSFLSILDDIGLAEYVFECFSSPSTDASLSSREFSTIVEFISGIEMEGYTAKDRTNAAYHLSRLQLQYTSSMQLEQFVAFYQDHPCLLKPLHLLQRQLRACTLGLSRWTMIAQLRHLPEGNHHHSANVYSFRKYRDQLITTFQVKSQKATVLSMNGVDSSSSIVYTDSLLKGQPSLESRENLPPQRKKSQSINVSIEGTVSNKDITIKKIASTSFRRFSFSSAPPSDKHKRRKSYSIAVGGMESNFSPQSLHTAGSEQSLISPFSGNVVTEAGDQSHRNDNGDNGGNGSRDPNGNNNNTGTFGLSAADFQDHSQADNHLNLNRKWGSPARSPQGDSKGEWEQAARRRSSFTFNNRKLNTIAVDNNTDEAPGDTLPSPNAANERAKRRYSEVAVKSIPLTTATATTSSSNHKGSSHSLAAQFDKEFTHLANHTADEDHTGSSGTGTTGTGTGTSTMPGPGSKLHHGMESIPKSGLIAGSGSGTVSAPSSSRNDDKKNRRGSESMLHTEISPKASTAAASGGAGGTAAVAGTAGTKSRRDTMTTGNTNQDEPEQQHEGLVDLWAGRDLEEQPRSNVKQLGGIVEEQVQPRRGRSTAASFSGPSPVDAPSHLVKRNPINSTSSSSSGVSVSCSRPHQSQHTIVLSSSASTRQSTNPKEANTGSNSNNNTGSNSNGNTKRFDDDSSDEDDGVNVKGNGRLQTATQSELPTEIRKAKSQAVTRPQKRDAREDDEYMLIASATATPSHSANIFASTSATATAFVFASASPTATPFVAVDSQRIMRQLNLWGAPATAVDHAEAEAEADTEEYISSSSAGAAGFDGSRDQPMKSRGRKDVNDHRAISPAAAAMGTTHRTTSSTSSSSASRTTVEASINTAFPCSTQNNPNQSQPQDQAYPHSLQPRRRWKGEDIRTRGLNDDDRTAGYGYGPALPLEPVEVVAGSTIGVEGTDRQVRRGSACWQLPGGEGGVGQGIAAIDGVGKNVKYSGGVFDSKANTSRGGFCADKGRGGVDTGDDDNENTEDVVQFISADDSDSDD